MPDVKAKSPRDFLQSMTKNQARHKLYRDATAAQRIIELEQELAELRADDLAQRTAKADGRPSNRRMGAKSPASEKAAEIEALREAMGDDYLEIVIEPLPLHVWRSFKSAHPARDGNNDDALFGIDTDLLMLTMVPQAVVEPELSDDDWQIIFQQRGADLSEMAVALFGLQETPVKPPKSRRGSQISRANGAG